MEQKYLQALEARFLRYVQIDTQSQESSLAVPSTEKQYELLRLLAQELEVLGAEEIALTDYATLFATLPATVDKSAPTVAFLAHVDTSPDTSGAEVKPLVHRAYDGRPIALPDDPRRVLDPQTLPALQARIGHDIITASGATLLGADDKAGVAIMMTLAQWLLEHPEIPHGELRLVFTPDEEIGRGVKHLRLEDLRADVAYTLDGGLPGEVTGETFSADKAVVTIEGVPAHTGTARGQLVNALQLAAKFISCLPQSTCSPEVTEGREGFIHLYQMQGRTERAELHFILRDFELEGLAAHRAVLQSLAETVQTIEPRARVTCEFVEQYRNMRYWLEKDPLPVELAVQAVRDCGLEPYLYSVRGGTDGARLTARGVPTPNLFTGMQNLHGPLEWISLQDMGQAVEVCARLATLWAGQADRAAQ
ncbi:MAG TPA: peptidase T [Chloroflexi bacterium]|nr:peptidase T [Chloroflexota bacterium]